MAVTVFALLAALPYALAPVRWNAPKSFYVDCESLWPGMAMTDALQRMSAYERDVPSLIAGATMYGVHETGAEHASRVIVVPSRDHAADWCVLYPDGDRLARVVISLD